MRTSQRLLFVALLICSLVAQAGTVTGAYALNFAPLADNASYSNPDLLVLDDPTTTESATISGGLLRSPDTSHAVSFRLDPSAYVPGNIIRAKVEAGHTGGVRDGVGVGILDASGNGYVLQVGNSNWVRYRYDAWAPHFDSGWAEPLAGADGDEAEIEYNKLTGDLKIYRNGSEVTVMATNDTTYTANSGLAPFVSHYPSDTGAGGVRSFAADGVTAAGGGSGGLLLRRRRN